MEDNSAVSEFYRFLEEEELANEQFFRSLDGQMGESRETMPSDVRMTPGSLLDFSDDKAEELEKMSALVMNSHTDAIAKAPSTEVTVTVTATEALLDFSDTERSTPPLSSQEGFQEDSSKGAKASDLLVFNALSNGSLEAVDRLSSAAERSTRSDFVDNTVDDKIKYNVLSVQGLNVLQRQSGDSSRALSNDSNEDTDKATIVNKFKRFGPGTYHINMRGIDIDASSVGYEIYIRPDVLQSDAQSLAGQVLLSLCGAVKTTLSDWGTLPAGVPSTEENKLSVLEVSNGAGAGVGKPPHWKAIKCTVGLNANKGRVLFILVTCSGATATTTSAADNNIITKLDPLNIFGINKIITASGSISRSPPVETAPLCTVIDLLLDHMMEALYDNNLDITSLLYHSPYQGGSSEGSVSYVLESILDPLFVRDLQQAAALEMFIALTAKASKMDAYIKHIEQQCAKMMTVLQPSYTRADLPLPSPPSPASLTSYKLELPRKPIFDVSIDQSKLLILKARRLVGSRGSCNDYIGLLNDLISLILTHIRSHVEEEGRLRLTRRKKYCQDRITSIECFKAQLLTLLDERTTSCDDIAPSDELLLTALHSRCRLLDPRSQPCLLDISNVCYLGRRGNAYVTKEYLYFHSPSTIFQPMQMKLISLKIVRAVAVTINGRVTILPKLLLRQSQSSEDLYKDDRSISILASKIANTIPQSNNSGKVENNVAIVLPDGCFEFFYIGGPTADHCHRVADVVNLLLQMRLWESESAGTYREASATVTSTTPTQVEPASSAVAGDAVGLHHTIIPAAANTSSEEPPPTQLSAAPSAKEPEKKKLARNIQAFLDKAKTGGK